ncbi:hypothetical protein M885DRAFT_528185 [Pelagophyceae sp. CCMP2097]|nr:hypothetical protein M885DRAFT_528185 [Pelagophyceae sp. CCMP2097]
MVPLVASRFGAALAVLAGAAVASENATAETARRLATGRLSAGNGARTSVFGGGRKSHWPAVARLQDAVRTDAHGKMRLAPEFADASDGQARWLARSVFAHTSLKQKPGVFVEFGARDGFYESNTLLYERSFGWTGVLLDAGRDYIHSLRSGRNCRASDIGGACVWAALDDEAGKRVFWSVFDTTSNRPVLDGYKEQTYQATAKDRAVKTLTLQHVLDRFHLGHVDYLSVDCEGCEAKALKTLNLTKTKVDVISVEFTPCETAMQLVQEGYVLLPLRFRYDQIFIHARVASQIPAPDLFLDSADEQLDLRGFQHAEKLSRTCPGVEDAIWWDGEWPPKRLERFADQ